MPSYALHCLDKPDSLDLRQSVRAEHLKFVAEQPLKVLAAGALRSEEDDMIGSLIVVEAPDLAAVETFADNDPYAKAGLFQSVSIRRWTVAIGAVGEPGKA